MVFCCESDDPAWRQHQHTQSGHVLLAQHFASNMLEYVDYSIVYSFEDLAIACWPITDRGQYWPKAGKKKPQSGILFSGSCFVTVVKLIIHHKGLTQLSLTGRSVYRLSIKKDHVS